MGSVYATTTDLFANGMPATAQGQFTTAQLNDGLAKASSIADSYLGGRYPLPLLTWDISITMYTCWIAIFIILGARGYNPAGGADATIEDRYLKAIAWFEGVQRKAIHPNVTINDVSTPSYAQPAVISSSVVAMNGRTAPNRGW